MNDDQLKKEYPELSIISIICKVVGVVIIIIAVIGLIKGFSLLGSYRNEEFGIYLIFSALLGGLLFSVPFFAIAEMIKLFIRIEFNTRKDNNNEPDKRIENTIQRQSLENNNNTEISYEDWKKQNPGKTINDYYREKKITCQW